MKSVNKKSELKAAIEANEMEIVVVNPELAKTVYKYKSIKKLTKRALVLLLAGMGIVAGGMALAPMTGGSSAGLSGVSAVAAYSLARASGAAIPVALIPNIVYISFMGSAILFALWKNYDIEVICEDPMKIKLKKK